MKHSSYVKHNEELLKNLPSYIYEYYLTKTTVPLSAATLYQYLNEFTRFFQWMIDNGISGADTLANIEITELENIKKTDVELYKSYLLNRGKQTAKNPRGTISNSTVNRSLNALSALFRYLTEESEDDNGEPYFYRNVMKKISLVRDSETYAARAKNIKNQLMLGRKDQLFLDFINNKYGDTLADNDRKRKFYERDKERDVAITALMLGTGIRVAELTNANLRDLNLTTATIDVKRKGGKIDSVPIAEWVLPYINNYLQIRSSRYNPTLDTPALFLTKGSNHPHRINTATVEQLIAKYSIAFNGVRITPHKLRHTLASKLYLETNNEHLVATQLGQSSTTATGLYTHIIDTKQRDALNKINKNKK